MRFEPMRAGETIRNNAMGETLTVLEGEQESGGMRQLYAVRVPPRRPSPPMHYHVALTETFTVMEGTLDFYLGRERRRVTLVPGQSVTAQIGQPHSFGNERDEWTTFTVETRPPGGVVAAFQMAYAVANAGGEGWAAAEPDRAAGLHPDESGVLAGVPLFLQRGLFAVVGWLARITGRVGSRADEFLFLTWDRSLIVSY